MIVLKFFLVFPTILVFFISCDRDVPEVDMDDVVISDNPLTQYDERPRLRIAVGAMISPETTRIFYEELLELVADRLGMKAVFLQRRSYEEVNALMSNREIELAFVCSGPYIKGHDQSFMEILVVPVSHGEKVYHSYIIVHKDSKLNSFDDLKGRIFAFTDPDSNTGCLVPTCMVTKRGYKPDSYFSETFYTHGHDSSIRVIAEEQADGAAIDSLIWEFINTIDPSLTSRTKIIEKSPPFGIPPVVIHPAMDESLKKRLKSAFLSLHLDKKAAILLSKLQIDKFDEGKDSDYDSVREMQLWIDENK